MPSPAGEFVGPCSRHRTSRWLRRVPAAAAAAVTLATLITAGGAMARERTTLDRPDDLVQTQQVHLLYVLPSDGVDRSYDSSGTIESSFNVAQSWLRAQDGGKPFALDTAGGMPDVTFVRLPETNASLASRGLNIRDRIEADLVTLGFSSPWKIYLVYYDGSARNTCGGGTFPPTLRGHVGALYLRGTFDDPAIPPCDSNPFALAGGIPGYREYSALHEVVHTLGFVPACAPHITAASHVSDSPRDLMYAGPEPWHPDTLDVGHDDYFDANIQGCRDLSTSGYLLGNPPQALPGESLNPPPPCAAAQIRQRPPGSGGGGCFDIDGDGVTDSVTVARTDGAGLVQAVLTSTGATIRQRFKTGPLTEPALVDAANFDGRPGAELLLHTDHISTFDTYRFVSLASGRLRVSSAFLQNSGLGDNFAFGFRCAASKPAVIGYAFSQRHTGGTWRRLRREWHWLRGSLRQFGATSGSTVRRPLRSERLVGC